MAEIIYQSTSIDVTFQAYLSSDHVSAATGKTIAITISKNKAAFGNPSAGATNATEIASGAYYVNLSTTDTGTLGPLILLGTATGVDPVNVHYRVRQATNADMTGIANAAAGAVNGLVINGTNSGSVNLGGLTTTTLAVNGDNVLTSSQITGLLTAQIAPLATTNFVSSQVSGLTTALAAKASTDFVSAQISGVTTTQTAIKAQTDKLTFDASNRVSSNMNATFSKPITGGSGTAADPFTY